MDSSPPRANVSEGLQLGCRVEVSRARQSSGMTQNHPFALKFFTTS